MEEHKAKISVIVPFYNAEATLEQCLESLVSQTIDRIEIVLVDNNSIDGSWGVAENYRINYPEKVKLIKEEEKGVSHARNAGLKVAEGSYIGFVDADDFVAPEMFEKLYCKAFESNSDIVACGRYNLDEGGFQLEKTYKFKETVFNLAESEWILRRVSTFVWDKIVRREVVLGEGLRFSGNIGYAEDFVFLMKAILNSRKIAIVDDPLYYYRVDSAGSITNTIADSIFDIIKALEEVNEYFIDRGCFLKYQEVLFRISVGFYVRRLKAFSGQGNRKIQLQFVDDFSKYFENYFEGFSISRRKETKSERFYSVVGSGVIAKLYVLLPRFAKSSLIKLVKKINKGYLRNLLYATLRDIVPVKKRTALFSSYSGSGLSGAPCYLLEDMVRDGRGVKASLLSNSPRKDRTLLKIRGVEGVDVIPNNSIKSLMALARSEFLVCNSRLPTFFSKKRGQKLLNTWHGTPVKTLGFNIRKGASDVWRNQNQFLMSDFLLFPNEHTEEVMLRDFGLKGLYSGMGILCCYPQNRVFLETSVRDEARKKLRVQGKKVIVYMPTWRGEKVGELDNETQERLFFDFLHEVDEVLGEEFVFYYKLHQLVRLDASSRRFKNIKAFPSDLEVYEVLSASDCLITDYSSVMFDYAYSGREIVLYTPDYSDYKASRGFYTDLDNLPFPRFSSTSCLMDHVKSSSVPNYIASEEFSLRFLKGDPVGAARFINSCLLSNGFSKPGAIESYKDFEMRSYYEGELKEVYFLPSLERGGREALEIVGKETEGKLVVVDANAFSDDYNSIIQDLGLQVVVVPSGTCFSVFDLMFIRAWRVMGRPRKMARIAYLKELNRILPNIGDVEFVDLSGRRKYKEISRIFN
ncbi:CDP-glycerol glycerophosphotransferase family protein [Halomonas mongoliensis]|uniref:CDP-glycerol glycerophosphotransferase family protein n=1 Tax=Halomonas mongoliensis TaxID=321265 RepID=A0ABU1GN71_9GAMM|nr:CDP-glycerol glycerophosphotransferase family protein [Halomonas mongoliensis]MDR5893424.1 CDP-glycerol glycerophosphotransferase family protein [Halomonas mongoliensis]